MFYRRPAAAAVGENGIPCKSGESGKPSCAVRTMHKMFSLLTAFIIRYDRDTVNILLLFFISQFIGFMRFLLKWGRIMVYN